MDSEGFLLVELEKAGDDFMLVDRMDPEIVKDQTFSDAIMKAQQSIVETRLVNYGLSRGFSAEAMTQSGWIKVDLGDKKRGGSSPLNKAKQVPSSSVTKHAKINEEEEEKVEDDESSWTASGVLQELDEEKELQQAIELSTLLSLLDTKSGELLLRLSEDGVEYTPHQCNYKVQYLRPCRGQRRLPFPVNGTDPSTPQN